MENEPIYRKSQNPNLLQRQIFKDFIGGLNYRSANINLRDNQLLVGQNIRLNSVDGGVTCRNGLAQLGTSNSSPQYNAFPATTTLISGASFMSNEISSTTEYGIFAVCADSASGGSGKAYFLYGSPHSTSQWSAITATIVTPAAYQKTRFAKMGNKLYFTNPVNALMEFTFSATSAPYGTVATVPSSTGYTPPSGAHHIIEYNNMIMCANNAANPQRLWFSAIGNAGLNTSWPDANFIDVGGTGDRDPIMGLCKCYGHLIIFKTNSIYALSGAGSSTFQLTNITNGLGIPIFNEGACVQAENDTWFLSMNGPWKIGADLTPVFMGYWIENRMKTLINKSSLTYSTNGQNMISYDSIGKHIYIQLYNTSPYDSMYVADMRITDDMGQHPFVSDSYSASIVPMTPMMLFDYPILTGIGTFTFFLSMSVTNFSVFTPNVDGRLTEGPGSVTFAFDIKTKYFNLGDPISKKMLRFASIITNGGRTTGGNITSFKTYSSDSPMVAEPTAVSQTVTPNQRNNVSSPTLNKYFSLEITDSASLFTSSFALYGIEIEFVNFGRRL